MKINTFTRRAFVAAILFCALSGATVFAWKSEAIRTALTKISQPVASRKAAPRLVRAVPAAAFVSSGIVISQVYGGAGCTTAGCSPYKNDYIELFNRGSVAVNVSGWSVQYSAATSSIWNTTSLPNLTIPAGGYLLIAEGSGTIGASLPTPDVTGSIAMSATAGKVALVNNTTALSGCPSSSSYIDLVGYGTTANCFEGGGTAAAPTSATAVLRASNGCIDTDSNSSDFAAGTPNPRNSASATNSCSSLPNLSINDVSLNEGNGGTTSFNFTVSLTGPAPAGGVTFDIATADNTATQPSDYTQKSLTSQTIPAGSSTYSFTVLVNGDTTPETTETFFVNVTNVTGANVADGQGQGTIINDDAAPNLTINDVTLNEGNAGTTTFAFTVSLTAPAPAGGVTFDIATANNTAVAPGDYTAKSLTSQTIPAGSSTYSFDVLVNGDTTPETDETFFVNVSNITNAIGTDTQGLGTITNDDLTRIHDVQGNGATTPLAGQVVTVEGVVTGNYQGTNKLQGFFLQEEDADADADPNTSEGIFIFCSTCPTTVAEGQRVKATGTVSEFNGMTEITASTAGSVVVTDSGNHLAEVTPVAISLPISGDIDAFYEAREGMKVTFVDTLTVSDLADQAQFGQIVLFQGGRPQQYTEFQSPSSAGYTAYLDTLARRKVILDDDNNKQNYYLSLPDGLQFLYYPRANGGFSFGTQGTDFFRSGDVVNGLTGVLHWSFPGTGANTWRIRPTLSNQATFTVANPRPSTPPSVGGAIKVVGMNLLNYFTTIDTTSSNSTGPCGPSGGQDCRGADSAAELNRQRERASIVTCSLNADVYAFMELENTTPSDTITDLLGAINSRCGGAHPYAFANTGGTLGTDAIRVQLIYRTGVVSPVGSPLVDLDPIHNRPPTAQTFDVVDATNPAFGKRFTVVANHFKSKGSCPSSGADADQNDGQACWNATRTMQATRLLTWINGTVIPAAGDPKVILLGDFNSYAKEDPITTITAGGYTDLETLFQGSSAYSYLFDGQLGHLDYALASAALLPYISGASAWHINADESDLFDYNDEVKDTGESTFEEKPDGSALTPPRVVFEAGSPYRASDHDPVLVGLFPTADLQVGITDGITSAIPGNSILYTITASNAGPASVSGATVTYNLPAAISSATWTCVGAGGGTCTASGSGSINDTVNLPSGGSVTYAVSVNIRSSATGNLISTATIAPPANITATNLAHLSSNDTDTLTPFANLGISKDDGLATAIPGTGVTYTITASNAGPSDAPGATVGDILPPALTAATWTCVGAGGGTCTSAGSGSIADIVNLPAGGSVTYTLSATISPSATVKVSNTALVNTTGGVTDPTPGNNSFTDTDLLSPQANLVISKNDGVTNVTPGSPVTYTITASNAGPSNAPGATVIDNLPASLTAATWTCVGAGGGTCTSAGSGSIVDTVNLPAGGVVTYTLSATISPNATGALTNTASVATPAGVMETDLSNNTSSDMDQLVCPSISSTNPANQSVLVGGTASFNANKSGSTPPAITIKWQVSSDNGATFNDVDSMANPSALTETLSLSNVTLAMNGYRYRAVVSNGCSTNTGQAATLNVSAFSAKFDDPLVCLGPGDLMQGTASFTSASPNGTPYSYDVSGLAPNLIGIPGSGVAFDPATNLPIGTITVTATTVHWEGNLNNGQSVSIVYKALLGPNVQQGQTVCVNVIPGMNGQQQAPMQICTVINCPAAGGKILVSDQKPGSVLMFPYYTSGNGSDTRITLTNTSNAVATPQNPNYTYVHLMFIDGSTCQQADQYVCLTPNASLTIKTSEYDPGATGWVLAVAVDANGIPIKNNVLIGNAFVSDGTYQDNYGAEAFAANGINNAPLAAVVGGQATLFFDGQSYDAVPKAFSVEVQSPVDVTGQKIVTVGLKGIVGSAMTGALQVGTGLVINGKESPASSFVNLLTGGCQAIGNISSSSPRVSLGMNKLIPSGQSGTVTFTTGPAIGVMMTPKASKFGGIRTLHKTVLTTTTITIPVFVPSC